MTNNTLLNISVFSLLNIGYARLHATWNWDNIYSPYARLYYVNGGCAKLRINGTIHRLRPGYLYLIPPFTKHDDICNSFFSLYYIHFYEQFGTGIELFDSLNFPVEADAESTDLQLIKRLNEINPNRELDYFDPQLYDNPPTISRYKENNKELPSHLLLETSAIITILMSRFHKGSSLKKKNMDTRISASLEYINRNINQYLSIEALACTACVTPDHFIRLFRSELGYTPRQYINRKKIERAQLLLISTEMSVADIAYSLNIENLSYFTRLFSQLTNKTPKQYRDDNSI